MREEKKSFDIINKSAHKSIKKGICKILCFSIFDLSSHPIFGYNVKDVSVIYKKIHGSINYRLWHTSCHTITIHTWFCDFIRPNTRTRIYISAKKKSIDYRWEYWTFTINYFLEHEWYLCPSLLLHTCVAYMSIVTFICDDYTTCLKIINCITQVMQVMIILGPCRNNWVTNFRQEWPSLLFCVYTHKMQIVVGKCRLHTVSSKTK